MPVEPLSPELALVDPELGARARATLPDRPPAPLAARRAAAAPPSTALPAPETVRAYPAWARMTAALWLVVVGILIGGTAIPHAQDRPRVVPPDEDVTICEPAPTRPTQRPPTPGSPLRP